MAQKGVMNPWQNESRYAPHISAAAASELLLKATQLPVHHARHAMPSSRFILGRVSDSVRIYAKR